MFQRDKQKHGMPPEAHCLKTWTSHIVTSMDILLVKASHMVKLSISGWDYPSHKGGGDREKLSAKQISNYHSYYQEALTDPRANSPSYNREKYPPHTAVLLAGLWDARWGSPMCLQEATASHLPRRPPWRKVRNEKAHIFHRKHIYFTYNKTHGFIMNCIHPETKAEPNNCWGWSTRDLFW